MEKKDNFICPGCGGELKYYDTIRRIMRTGGGRSKWIYVRREKCTKCGHVQRILPDSLFPYKHYDSEIIKGVLEGLITPETLGYEDYPSEVTMQRWLSQRKQGLL